MRDRESDCEKERDTKTEVPKQVAQSAGRLVVSSQGCGWRMLSL